MADFIPRPDEEFHLWAKTFLNFITVQPVDVGLEAPDVAPLTALMTEWEAALTDHNAAQTTARAKRTAKDDVRTRFEAALRAMVRRLQASAEVNDEERAAMGITVADAEPTPAGPVATRPLAQVDTSERLRHVVSFRDAASPTSRARPAGVMGCEIWVKVGDPAPQGADDGGCHLLALDTASPYLAEYGGADAGKTAHYILRWVTTRGEKGPWSETVAATIGA